MGPEDAVDARAQADVDLSPLVDAAAKGYTVELEGHDRLPGGETFKLVVRGRDGPPRTMHLDTRTHLVVEVLDVRQVEGKPVAFVTEIGDYRSVGGLVFPHRMEVGPRDSPRSGLEAPAPEGGDQPAAGRLALRDARRPRGRRLPAAETALCYPDARGVRFDREVLHGLVDLGSRRSRPPGGRGHHPRGLLRHLLRRRGDPRRRTEGGRLGGAGVGGVARVHDPLRRVPGALFRKPLMRRFNLSSGKPVDRLEGESAVVIEEVPPGGVGKAEMRGASWTARTAGESPLAKGHRCRVERVEGLTLWLRAE
jgi:hypothetical protein